MSSTVTWDMRLYDLEGDPIETVGLVDDVTETNLIQHAFERKLEFVLNSIDSLSFSLYLNDPMAYEIRRGACVVKVFRSVVDVAHGVSIDGDTNPIFCGVVSRTKKSGAENKMSVTCMSPLWRLQTHFHLLNHYLEMNIDTGDYYTSSELMWKLIELVNQAFGGDSFTGISQGTFSWGAPNEPYVAPYFVGRGTNTWSNIFDDIMNRPGGPDIIPEYFHSDGLRRQMYFSTDQRRGSDISSTFSFRYKTNSGVQNTENLEEEEAIIPGEFGNYLWVVGAGGPNSGRRSRRENVSATVGSDGYGEIGVYMLRIDRSEIKRVKGDGGLNQIANAEFLKRKHPQASYAVTVAPGQAHGHYYDDAFSMGDVVALNANRGALQVTNVDQRIYQVGLSMSENNLETCNVLIADDFYGKVQGS